MKDFYVTAAMLEDMAREHGAHTKSEPVIQPNWRTVVHHPEPDEWLAFGILCGINIAIIFRLERGIARIERKCHGVAGEIADWRGIGAVKIELGECIAHNQAPVFGIWIAKLGVEIADPVQERLLSLRRRAKIAVIVSG